MPACPSSVPYLGRTSSIRYASSWRRSPRSRFAIRNLKPSGLRRSTPASLFQQRQGHSAHPRSSTELAEARSYLIQTASPGYTMAKQGSELAIERLHREFAIRLTKALREARDYGLRAGIFSAYRPPAFGVGGFSDKFNSLHAYGLAVDLYGIGRPGSVEALWWHEIAAKHGLICPYGHHDRAEWNHCQPTGLKIVSADNLLRETITADGPVSLEAMFEAGNSIVENPSKACDAVGRMHPCDERRSGPRVMTHLSPSKT